jgi:hypothetical protein
MLEEGKYGSTAEIVEAAGGTDAGDAGRVGGAAAVLLSVLTLKHDVYFGKGQAIIAKREEIKKSATPG